MRLTSKGRYAVTAMLDVALHSHEGPVPLADISERQGISLSYLEQLFSRLRKTSWFPAFAGRAAGIFWHAVPVRFSLLRSSRLSMNPLMRPAVREPRKAVRAVTAV